MSEKLATIYIWITMLVSTVVIIVMFVVGTPQETVKEAEEVSATITHTDVFYAMDDEVAENSMQVTLPDVVEEQHVTIENDYRNKTLRICVSKQAQDAISVKHFYENPIRVNLYADSAEMNEDAGMVTITFEFDTVFEWETKFQKENGSTCLNLQLVTPKEKYEKIVVLDAGHGGSDTGYTIAGEDESLQLREDALAFAVVTAAGKRLEKDGIKVYYTRQEETNPTEEARVELANETQADMLISIHADYNEDTSVYGMRTIYNETYFIPNFASADLAYLLLEKVAASTNEKAIGFEPAKGDNSLIQNAMIPVAQLNVGYLSNRQEQKLLTREDYIERIADGICEAVKMGYKEIEK